MTESELWKKFKENLCLDYAERVENRIGVGTPDIFYIHDAMSGWVEMKCEDTIPSKLRFEPAQPIWLDKYWHLGGDCYVFLYVKKTNEIRVWWGRDAIKLNKIGGPQYVPTIVTVKNDPMGWKKIYKEIFLKVTQDDI